MTEERRRHGLTDEEIKKIAAELESRLVSRFYLNVGKVGVMGTATIVSEKVWYNLAYHAAQRQS